MIRYRLLYVFLLPVVILANSAAGANQLIVAAANSTCTVIKTLIDEYQHQQKVDVELICKSSGRLAKGLAGGAIRADIFISANKKWMDYATTNGIVAGETIATPWGNALAVVAPANSPLEMTGLPDLAKKNIQTIIIGDPGTAPFGRYAKQAMETTGIWDEVLIKLQTRKHITLAAETLAQADEHTVGILFVTNIDDQLKTLYIIDESLHDPVRYYLALTSKARGDPLAESLLNFLLGNRADDLFKRAGFLVLNK